MSSRSTAALNLSTRTLKSTELIITCPRDTSSSQYSSFCQHKVEQVLKLLVVVKVHFSFLDWKNWTLQGLKTT